jgi:hypothetical protein
LQTAPFLGLCVAKQFISSRTEGHQAVRRDADGHLSTHGSSRLLGPKPKASKGFMRSSKSWLTAGC